MDIKKQKEIMVHFSFLIIFLALFNLAVSLFIIVLVVNEWLNNFIVNIALIAILLFTTWYSYHKYQIIFHVHFAIFGIIFIISQFISYNFIFNFTFVTFLAVQFVFFIEVLSGNLMLHVEQCLKCLK